MDGPSDIRKGSDVELTVEDVTFGGQGVARLDGYVVLISGAVTGDVVRARILKRKSRFAEAAVVDILQPAQSRVPSPCDHFGVCGGCKWLNIDYATQLEFKRKNIEDVFRRIGGLENIAVPSPVPSPRLHRYRNKMEFTFGDRPWFVHGMTEPIEPFALGLHTPRNYLKVVDINHCHLQSEAANRVLLAVREFARTSGEPPYNLKTYEGFWRFLVIRPCVHTDDLMVNVMTSRDHDTLMPRFAEYVLARCPEITSLIHSVTGRRSQVALGEKETVLYGSPTITERIGRFEFEIAAGSFFQTNTLGAEQLYRTVVDMGRFDGHERVYDLYCGTGTIGIFLSEHVKHVVGVELVSSAVENARRNAAHNAITNCTFLAGDIRRTLAELPDIPDVVVVDPPRSGLHPDVTDALIHLHPKTILYVSCDPATQARDLSTMIQGPYVVTACQPVDMFPHTYHVENVVRVDRSPA